MVGVEDIKKITDKILKDNENITVHIPLKDLVWSIVSFSHLMSYHENEAFMNPFIFDGEREKHINNRELLASRRDELARLISQYTDFPTQRIWDIIKEENIFKDYNGCIK